MKTFITALGLFCSIALSAQSVVNPFPKTITVNGSAEMEIIPDEIYVQVDLKEYDKKGGSKVGLETIKNDFLAAIRRLGIPDSAISIAAYDSYHNNPWLLRKKKKEEMFASLSYQVLLRSSEQMDRLVAILDDQATQNFFILRTAHSKLPQLRKDLKIAAVKAAREKGIYLAEAIGEKIGTAVTIHEPAEYHMPYYNAANMMLKERAQADGAEGSAAVDFRKIKLKYDVSVVFSLM